MHDDAAVDTGLQFVHMGDDPHQPVVPGQGQQRSHRGGKAFAVQGAKALVHEQRVHGYPAGTPLHHIGQPQGQGQGGLETLAAGQSFRGAWLSGVVVYHSQLQPTVVEGGLEIVTDQLIPPAGHAPQAQIGRPQDLIKIGGLDVGLESDFFPPRQPPVGSVGQFPGGFKLPVRLFQQGQQGPQLLRQGPVLLQTGADPGFLLPQGSGLRLNSG